MPDPFPTARNPLLSTLQSAAAALARRGHSGVQDGTGHSILQAAAHLVATRPGIHNGASADPARAYSPATLPTLPSSDCARLGLELLEAAAAGDTARQTALHDRLAFSRCDPLWAETLLAYARNLGWNGRPKPIPYIRHTSLTDFILPAPSPTMRIALLSDWGTGTATARAVAALLARQRPDAVIHLGDIYYSGTPEECAANFLAPLRDVLPETPLFTLCGNHDTYSGGRGYYGLLEQIGQPASYFCLRSPDQSWQLLALDTGLNDHDPFNETAAVTALDPAEEAWHLDKLRGFPGRTILLSHHQPFSAYAQIGPQPGPQAGPQAARDPTNPNLMQTLARLQAAGAIDAWFWGHEHRLCLYAPYRGLARGRIIGYGAIPVEAVPGPVPPLPNLLDPPPLLTALDLDVVEGAYTHGFALLDLSPAAAEASYWTLTRPDAPIYRESLAPPITASTDTPS